MMHIKLKGMKSITTCQHNSTFLTHSDLRLRNASQELNLCSLVYLLIKGEGHISEA